jgi:hypothetical protein
MNNSLFWFPVASCALALSLVACGSDVQEPVSIASSGGSVSVATGGTSATSGGSTSATGGASGSGGKTSSSGGASSTGGTAPEPDCYEHPKTHHEIINACTTAMKIEKHPNLKGLNPDGTLPTL